MDSTLEPGLPVTGSGSWDTTGTMCKNLSLTLLLTLLIGCNSGGKDLGHACTAEYRAGVTLTLTEAGIGEPITDATAVLTADGFEETMKQPSDGFYWGAHERVGTYSLTVSAPDFLPATQAGIVVPGDVCHVMTQQIAISLVREPAGTFGLLIVVDGNGDRVTPVRIGVR